MALLPADPAKRGRAKLALLGALFSLPLLLAWVLWRFDLVPGGGANYGELLPPKEIRAAPLAALKGRWVLVQLDGGACDAYCERKLYFMRLVRRAMGREMRRVERLWIVTDSTSPAPRLLEAIEGTTLATGDPGLVAAFPGAPSDHIYLVDPLGNLMLRFPRDPDPSRMIKDLQRLLRYSGFG